MLDYSQTSHIGKRKKIMINVRSLVFVLGMFAVGCSSCSSESPSDASVDATVARDVVVVEASTEASVDAADASVVVDAAQDRLMDAAHD